MPTTVIKRYNKYTPPPVVPGADLSSSERDSTHLSSEQGTSSPLSMHTTCRYETTAGVVPLLAQPTPMDQLLHAMTEAIEQSRGSIGATVDARCATLPRRLVQMSDYERNDDAITETPRILS